MKSWLQEYKEDLIERQPKWFKMLSSLIPSRYFDLIDIMYVDITKFFNNKMKR